MAASASQSEDDASLNMVGILYTGADIGGFGSDTTEDLVMRWIQLAMFSPLMRNHTALGTRMQEVYQFDHVEQFAGTLVSATGCCRTFTVNT